MLNEDDILNISPEEKIQARESEIQEMRGKYSAAVMTQLLKASYKLLTETHDVYSTKHAYIFSPSTDKLGCDLSTVDVLLKSFANNNLDYDRCPKVFVFPIAEQQPAINIPIISNMGWIPPRNHWVTLHYDTKTQIATVIDSRPFLNSSMYSYKDFKVLLAQGLAYLGLSMKEFTVVHQGLQLDDTYCGAWTAINIESLAYGASIDSLCTAFKSEDISSIVEHHIDRVFHSKKDILRQDLINSDLIDALQITLPDISAVVNAALNAKDASSIAKLLNHRENIIWDGKPFSLSNPLLPIHLPNAIQCLSKQYRGFLATQIACQPNQKTGFSLKDPGRLLNNLQHIGLSEEQINQLSLIQVLFYDAVIFDVMSNIESQIQTQIADKLSRLNEVTQTQAAERLNELKVEARNYVLPVLKDLILKDYRPDTSVKKRQVSLVKSWVPQNCHQNFRTVDSACTLGNHRGVYSLFAVNVNSSVQIQVDLDDVNCILLVMKMLDWELVESNRPSTLSIVPRIPDPDVTNKSPVNVPEEPPVNVTEEPPVNVTEEPPVNVTEEPPVNVTEEPPVNVTEEPPVNVTEEPPVNVTTQPEDIHSQNSNYYSAFLWALILKVYEFFKPILDGISQYLTGHNRDSQATVIPQN